MTSRLAAPCLALALAALGGCAQGPSPAEVQAAREPPAGFHCPAPGTTVRGSDGREIIHRGVAADDAEVCLISLTVGGRTQEVRALFSIAALSRFTPGEERAALRALFPLAPGKSASWLTHDFYGEAWTVSVQVVGRETITVPAGTFDTWRLQLGDRGFGFNSWEVRMHRWVLEDGTVIQQRGEVVRGGVPPGSPFLQSWSATAVIRP
ncbi:DUF3108 domain-containing protein [Elioraea rosea]|uniref:DUF3108 domain-containing protein n=1 Tax=Elioraea rosea TaxID=2492390 RepID=UPI001183CCB0|nr:DUF3108 domain-containing protein [Elioraea rosea]